MSQPQDKLPSKKRFDLLSRGSKKPSPLGTAIFISLRVLDIPWQYYLLQSGAAESAIASLQLPLAFRSNAPPAIFPATISSLPSLDLPLPHLIILTMAAASTFKHVLWLTCLSQDEFPASAAIVVSSYNTLVNSVNSLLFFCAVTSSWVSSGPRVSVLNTKLPLTIVLGSAAYLTGMSIEMLSEYQRLKFKREPRNQGKVCKVGLWSWARHINYFGYALWRGGYCMTASGWIGGLAMGIFQGWDLSTRGVEVLDEYCANRYGEQWAQFRRDVPYRIIPGIY